MEAENGGVQGMSVFKGWSQSCPILGVGNFEARALLMNI